MKRRTTPEPEEEKKKKEKKGGASAVKVVAGLVAMAAVVIALPLGLSQTCRVVQTVLPWATLPSVWGMYLALTLAAVLWWRRGKLTLDSFFTQQAAHLILSLGAYHFLHVGERVPFELRRTALWVWLSFTMALNVAVLFIDTTDYAAQAAEEAAHAKRKEERRKQRQLEREANEQEKRKKKERNAPFWRRNRAVKVVLDVLIYAAMLGVIAWLGWTLWRYNADFKAGKIGPGGQTPEQEKVWGYESQTGIDHTPQTVEDYELEQVVTGPTRKKP